MFRLFKNRQNLTLFDSAQDGELKKNRELLDKGAHVNAKSGEEEYTALMVASMEGQTEVAKVPLEAGASTSI